MSSKTYPTLLTETKLFASGNRFVIGIDEVGRGAIAGPVAVGVVLLDSRNQSLSAWPNGLMDSKLMTPKTREQIYDELASWVDSFAVGMATNQEIDELGISESLKLAAARGLSRLTESAELRKQLASEGAAVLLDGSHNWLGEKAAGLSVQTQVKADTACVSVAAASVLAKVERDRLMLEIDASHEGFGLASNKGYASSSHISALKARGPSPIHRRTWLGRILGQ